MSGRLGSTAARDFRRVKGGGATVNSFGENILGFSIEGKIEEKTFHEVPLFNLFGGKKNTPLIATTKNRLLVWKLIHESLSAIAKGPCSPLPGCLPGCVHVYILREEGGNAVVQTEGLYRKFFALQFYIL